MTHEVEWFKRFPNGGTVFVRPSDSGNPYASAEETQEVVVVELPEYEEGQK